MAQYLMSVWHDDEYEIDFESQDMQRIGPKVAEFNGELEAAGAEVFAGGLEPASSAKVLRADAGSDVSISDGPYAMTRQQMGGFWVIEAADPSGALAWATRAAAACERPVELRPFQGA